MTKKKTKNDLSAFIQLIVEKELLNNNSFLFEADPKRDLQLRNEALKIFNWIKSIVENKKDREWLENDPGSRIGRFTGFLLVPDMHKQWSKEHPNLYVVLGPEDSYTVDLGSTGSGYTKVKSDEGHYIHVVILPVLEGPYRFGEKVNLNPLKKNFIHELTHYLDVARADEPWEKENTYETRSEYINTPQEYNAHFQEGMEAVDDYIQQRLKHIEKGGRYSDVAKKGLKKAFSDFDSFEKFVEKKMPRDFVERLVGKYEKKYLQRVYQTFEYYKEILGDVLSEELEEVNAIGAGGVSATSGGGAAAWGGSNDDGLYEATSERDADYRKRARVFLRYLRDTINQNQSEIKQRKVEKYKGFLVKSDLHSQWKKHFPDLHVILASRSVVPIGEGAIGTSGNDYVLIIGALKGDYILEDAAKRVTVGVPAKAIVHEMTHYFDKKRWKGEPTKGHGSDFEKGAAGVSSDPQRYFNDPLEFNAHFQEAVNEIEIFLRTIAKKIKAGKMRSSQLKRYLKDYDSFERFAVGKFEPNFLTNLNPKFEKKFLQRLYQTFEHMEDKYGEYMEQ